MNNRHPAAVGAGMEYPVNYTFPCDTGAYLAESGVLAVAHKGVRIATFRCIAADGDVMRAFLFAAESLDPFSAVNAGDAVSIRDWNLARTMYAVGALVQRGMIDARSKDAT
jgi:hypothetical protein